MKNVSPVEIPSVFFFCFLVFIPAASGQVDPLAHLASEAVNTRNFEIVVRKTMQPTRPTPKEVGILVERLCAQLDKIFQRYASERVADEIERQGKTEKSGGKSSETRDLSKNREVDQADPNRVIPKCRIFIFNESTPYLMKCRYDGIDTPADPEQGYAGFFTTKNNSIYMVRSGSVQSTRQTILHETTHYYTFNFLPGGWRCYPTWFHEGLAMSYEKHIWNGDKLTVGATPRIQPFDGPASSLKNLLRFRDYLQVEAAKSNPEDEPAPPEAKRNAKKTARKETPIDPALIQPFLDTMFTDDIFRKEGITRKHPNEEIAHKYAMYQTFGRFLIVARPDHLGAILRQIALWEKSDDKTFPRERWFVEAWKKAAETKPITVEEIGRWVRKNQLPFKWSFGDWQDLEDMIAGKAEDGMISILALSNPDALPRFTVYPKDPTKFQAGLVLNFIDNENFSVVAVDQDGDVLLMEKRGGSWTGAKRIGKTGSAGARNNPYGNGPSFQFATARQGNMIAVQINKMSFGTYPKIPEAGCGFFLSSTEGTFSY